MLLGNAAKRPQRILQALGQCDEALAAKDDMGMLETRECQSEVIEPMRQRDAGNRDAERARVGEVGQAKTAGLVLLPEDDILFWTGQRSPTPYAPLQRAPDAGADLGVAPPELFENRNGADAGAAFRIGMISLSQTSASGSGRRRPRGAFFRDGRRGSFSIQ
jgi:hypothetical protein